MDKLGSGDSEEYIQKPDDRVIDEIADSLAQDFPWSRDDWERFIQSVLVKGEVPHRMCQEDRLRYYIVVAQAIAAKKFCHLPYISGTFGESDLYRFFRTVSVGLDPKGDHKGTIDFTCRRLSSVFKDKAVAILDDGQKRDEKNPIDLILTTRNLFKIEEGESVPVDFSDLLTSSDGPINGVVPMVIQLPVYERLGDVSPLDPIEEQIKKIGSQIPENRAGKIALEKAVEQKKPKKSSRAASSERTNREMDIRLIHNFPEAFVYALLFPTSRSVQFSHSYADAHSDFQSKFYSLLKGGWLVREIAPILSDKKHNNVGGIPRQILSVLEHGFEECNSIDGNRRSNLARKFVLHALAVQCALRKDHPKLQSVIKVACPESSLG